MSSALAWVQAPHNSLHHPSAYNCATNKNQCSGVRWATVLRIWDGFREEILIEPSHTFREDLAQAFLSMPRKPRPIFFLLLSKHTRVLSLCLSHQLTLLHCQHLFSPAIYIITNVLLCSSLPSLVPWLCTCLKRVSFLTLPFYLMEGC